MGQDLVGYLLDALDATEQSQVREALEDDPQLQDRLTALRSEIQWTESARYQFTPPAGLTDQTMAFIDRQTEGVSAAVKDAQPPDAVTAISHASSASNWRTTDWIVAASLLAATVLLAVPFIGMQREEARKIACQKQLLSIGKALTDYSTANNGTLPQIAPAGNRAVAGVFAPTLRDNGFSNSEDFFCPSSEFAAKDVQPKLVTLEELDAAEGDAVPQLQERLSPSYGYNMGYLIDGKYRPAQDLRRSTHPLVTDAPAVGPDGKLISNRHGYGQNVLFEGMHVRFIQGCKACSKDDDFFRNRRGEVHAGVDMFDAVIGASAASPFPRP